MYVYDTGLCTSYASTYYANFVYISNLYELPQ